MPINRTEKKVALALVGKRITVVEVRPDRTVHLTIEGGIEAAVMRDPEGNGPGALHVMIPELGPVTRVIGGE